jgi:hypothetical protein
LRFAILKADRGNAPFAFSNETPCDLRFAILKADRGNAPFAFLNETPCDLRFAICDFLSQSWQRPLFQARLFWQSQSKSFKWTSQKKALQVCAKATDKR